jgi:hypothetical protein
MSRFSGKQGRGAAAALKGAKRAEAEQRQEIFDTQVRMYASGQNVSLEEARTYARNIPKGER